MSTKKGKTPDTGSSSKAAAAPVAAATTDDTPSNTTTTTATAKGKAPVKAPAKAEPPTPKTVVVGETFGTGMNVTLTDAQFEKLVEALKGVVTEAVVKAIADKVLEACSREILEPMVKNIGDCVSDIRDASLQTQLSVSAITITGGAREGATRNKPPAVKTSAPKVPSNAKILFKQEFKVEPEVRKDHQTKYATAIKDWRDAGKGKEWMEKDKNHDGSAEYFGKEADLVWEKLSPEDKKIWQDKHKALNKAGAPVENDAEE